ncbi:MAG: alpha-L-fucosidase [Bacteroidaceae bacterium]|nr:alpha-L-fucosidase [Bacteroidaceae bacterium]
MTKKLMSLLLVFMATMMSSRAADVVVDQDGPFQPTWESTAQWECPEWFKDAKFGIWAHWGPQCQAEDGDWYARFMYYSGTGQYNWHVSHFGNPSVYGLKELCRDWTASQWDPEELVALYKSVGARYFMTLGNHHDNFDLWNSPYQEWNSVNIGPKRDIVKGWSDACKNNGLPLGVSMHASHAWTWLEPSQSFDGNLTKADGVGTWWEGYDPQELYAQKHDHSSGWASSGTIHSQWAWGNGASLPSEAYKMKFQNRVLQCINDYQPDMLYFDDTVLPFYGCDESIGLNILTHYYNKSAAQHDGQQQVVTMGKILNDAQKESLLWDVERGIPDRPQAKYWQTCTCIGDWHYNINNTNYKSAEQVVSMLVDIVSKNGNLLLSVPIRGNGTIDNKERNVLAGIKAWMDINSESIYGTRVWKTFGEGPLAEAVNPISEQGFNEKNDYSAKDVRYVQKDDKVYATIMRWPAAGAFTFKAFSVMAESYSGKVKDVELLGYGDVTFSQDAGGLTVDIPANHINSIAPVMRITFEEGEQSAGELLAQAISETETVCAVLELDCSDINTGKYGSSALAVLKEALAQAKTVDGTDEEAASAALTALREAYQDFMNKGRNEGGVFNRTVDENLTAAVLVEAENFSGTLGGRYGKLANWISENYSINKGGDGVRNGLDNYGNKRGISIGVWDDRSSNQGDISNARIYRKVHLDEGVYYFGAAYNSLYGCNNKAWQFVSKELLSTDDIPDKSLACYQVNTAKEGSELYGLYVEITEAGDYFLGWQADMNNGSEQQEFRAIKVAFYSLAEEDLRPVRQKLAEGGWEKVDAISADMNFDEYYFAFVEHNAELSVVARAHDDNGKNWGNVYVMSYDKSGNPCKNPTDAWMIEAFDADGKPAVGSGATKWILTCVAEQNRQFRTEGWSKVVWQTYSDFGGSKGDNDSNRSLAFLMPEYDGEKGWALKNVTSAAYVGAWENVVEDGQEFAANKTESAAAHMDIYRILRTDWMKQYDKPEKATETNPLNISYLINNPSFERYDEQAKPIAWVSEGEGVIEKGYLSGCDNKLYMNNWQGSGRLSDRSVSQTVHNLPAGKYRLTAYSMCDGDGALLFAGEKNAEMKHDGNADTSLDFELTETTDLTIGVRLKDYSSNNFKFDNIRLYYLGGYEDPTAIGGVPAAPAASSAPAAYYTLSGLRLLKAPTSGIYIEVKNGQSRKITR